jgi:RHS repeat-associated protein
MIKRRAFTHMHQGISAGARWLAVGIMCLVMALFTPAAAQSPANLRLSVSGPLTGTAGQPVSIKTEIVSITGVQPIGTAIDYGDGTQMEVPAGVATLTKIYARAGTFTIRLSAIDQDEITYSVTTTATIGAGLASPAMGSLTASPNPIPVAPGVASGSTTLRWTSNVDRIQIFRGPLANVRVLTTDATTPRGGSLTVADAANGETFFLQDASRGTSQSPANTLAQVTVNLAMALPPGTGLRGSYFDGPAFNRRVFTRIDPRIDFDFGAGKPDPRLRDDLYAIRWVGQLIPRETGSYSFVETSDDGVRLFVGGQRVIDRFLSEGPAAEQRSGPVMLTAGQPVPLVMAYFEDIGAASVRLEWIRPNGVREIIPASQLIPAPETSGTLTATPRSVMLTGAAAGCTGNAAGTGNTSLSWTTTNVTAVKIFENGLRGREVARGGPAGSSVCVPISHGTTLLLQDASDPALERESFSTLASVAVSVDRAAPPAVSADAATNRLVAANGGLRYDATGNLIGDSVSGAGERVYDGQNRLTSAFDGVETQRIAYDANGRRIRRSVGRSDETWLVYGIDGELLAEYPRAGDAAAPLVEYAYRNGDLITEVRGVDRRWFVKDHLGSTRMTVDGTGDLAGIQRIDYLPFGEELGEGNGGRTAAQGYRPAFAPLNKPDQRFAGLARDDELGLDLGGARNYSPTLGRFTSTDPALDSMSLRNPQTLNRYSYALNLPTRLIDPTGEVPQDRGGEGVVVFFPGIRNATVEKTEAGESFASIANRTGRKPQVIANAGPGFANEGALGFARDVFQASTGTASRRQRAEGADVLSALISTGQNENATIIAHSNGNAALAAALEAGQFSAGSFGSIVLFAPNIGKPSELATIVAATRNEFTLFTSPRDNRLRFAPFARLDTEAQYDAIASGLQVAQAAALATGRSPDDLPQAFLAISNQEGHGVQNFNVGLSVFVQVGLPGTSPFGESVRGYLSAAERVSRLLFDSQARSLARSGFSTVDTFSRNASLFGFAVASFGFSAAGRLCLDISCGNFQKKVK